VFKHVLFQLMYSVKWFNAAVCWSRTLFFINMKYSLLGRCTNYCYTRPIWFSSDQI